LAARWGVSVANIQRQQDPSEGSQQAGLFNASEFNASDSAPLVSLSLAPKGVGGIASMGDALMQGQRVTLFINLCVAEWTLRLSCVPQREATVVCLSERQQLFWLSTPSMVVLCSENSR
jgi:hypothetical protein